MKFITYEDFEESTGIDLQKDYACYYCAVSMFLDTFRCGMCSGGLFIPDTETCQDYVWRQVYR